MPCLAVDITEETAVTCQGQVTHQASDGLGFNMGVRKQYTLRWEGALEVVCLDFPLPTPTRPANHGTVGTPGQRLPHLSSVV